MLATLKTHFDNAYRFRHRLTGRSRRMVDRYLVETRPHDAFITVRFTGRERLTVFDVGACECLDSIRYRRQFPTATVHAFEANPKNVARAKETLARFGGDEIVLNGVALSDTVGELDFFCSEGAPDGKMNDKHWDYGNKSGSILEPDMEKIHSVWNWLNFRKQEKIPCTTLTAYCEANQIETIDLLHLDVQGAELLVLKGALPMIQQIDSIWLEVSSERFHVGQAVADDLHSFLQVNGFTRHLQDGNGLQWDELWCR
jgi:FkbM family methyltransferase